MEDIRILRNFNMNKLPILWELLRCRNVSAAALNLNLTQSTVSSALKYLREYFSDELLVSNGREYFLTEKALNMMPEIDAALSHSIAAIGKSDFDPATAETSLRIVTADYISTILLPDLLKDLEIEAPKIKIQMLSNVARVTNDLRLGSIDLVIGPKKMLDWIDTDVKPADLRIHNLFDDVLVGVKSNKNPRDFSSLNDYLAQPHAVVCLDRYLPANLEIDFLGDKNLTQNVRIFVPNFSILPVLIENTELISVIPKTLAEYFSPRFEIDLFSPPLKFPNLDICAISMPNRDRDRALKWLIGKIKTVLTRYNS